jgi:hypothetical protein
MGGWREGGRDGWMDGWIEEWREGGREGGMGRWIYDTHTYDMLMVGIGSGGGRVRGGPGSYAPVALDGGMDG